MPPAPNSVCRESGSAKSREHRRRVLEVAAALLLWLLLWLSHQQSERAGEWQCYLYSQGSVIATVGITLRLSRVEIALLAFSRARAVSI